MKTRSDRIADLARATAVTAKAILPKKLKLSEKEQLRNFEADGSAGYPKLKALIDEGKLRSAADWIRAMDKIRRKQPPGG